MKPKIEFRNIWFDNTIAELKISVSDGISIFSNTAYIANGDTKDLIKQLNRFRKQIHGGLRNINFGNRGFEYANGVFEARLHFFEPGKVSISTFQQSDYSKFTKRLEASEAKFFLTAEPSSLDNFIEELKSLENEIDSTATLLCT